MMETGGSREINLMEYWNILLRRRWVVFTAVVVLVTTVTIGSFLMTPIYKATATIQIERDQPNVLQFQQVQAVGYDYMSYTDFYQTQNRLLESRNVARKTVYQLDLKNDPLVNRLVVRRGSPGMTRRLTSFLRPSPGEEVPPDPDRPYIQFLQSGLDINPLKSTHLVEISFTSVDPELSARIANGVANSFIEFNQSVRYDTTAQATEFLTTQTGELKKQIDDLDAKLNEYGKKNEIIGLDDKENIINQKLAQLNSDVLIAQVETSRKEARYRGLLKATPDSLPETSQSNLITQLRSKSAELERQYMQQSKQFKADWPEMGRLKAEWDNARQTLAEESRKIFDDAVKAAELEYQQAAAHERNVRAALETHKNEAIRQKQFAGEYANLKAAVDSKRAIFDKLLQRETETGQLSRLKEAGASNIWVVDSAEVPEWAFRPNKRLNVLLSFLVGLSLGIGMAFFLEYLDNSIKSTSDVEKFVQLPMLGTIPMVVAGDGHSEAAPRGRPRKDPAPVEVDLVTLKDPTSGAAEAYKTLRTSLLLSTADAPPRVIVVTSSEPQEGKTMTTLNTAIALTQSGRRVLLVDGDMRRPRLHKALGVANTTGLSHYLSGNAGLNEILVETGIPNLTLVPSGPIPPNPSELLASEHFDALVKTLRQSDRFDHVLIDSPPLLSVADPVIMASKVAATILVIQCGRTARQSVIRGRQKLEQAKANVLGVVLNDVDMRHDAYYGGYKYTYRYRAYRPKTEEGEAVTVSHPSPPVA